MFGARWGTVEERQKPLKLTQPQDNDAQTHTHTLVDAAVTSPADDSTTGLTAVCVCVSCMSVYLRVCVF